MGDKVGVRRWREGGEGVAVHITGGKKSTTNEAELAEGYQLTWTAGFGWWLIPETPARREVGV